MLSATTRLRRIAGYIKAIGLSTSLTLAALACQTTEEKKPDAQSQEKALLKSQKALVRNALDNGKPESALKNLRELLEAYPKDTELHNLMGLTQLTLKNVNRATKHFQTAFSQDPQVGTGLNLSSALLETGDYVRADKLLKALSKEAIKSKYRYKERIYHNLGYSALKQRKLSQAESWFKKALEENPTFFPSHIELARFYENSRNFDKAILQYRLAADYCHNCLEPLEALTDILMAQGRHFEAKQTITKFLRNEDLTQFDREKATALMSKLPALPSPVRGTIPVSKAEPSPAPAKF